MAFELNVAKDDDNSSYDSLVIDDNTGDYTADNDTGYRAEIQVTNATTLNGSGVVIRVTINGVLNNFTEGVQFVAVAGDITTTCNNIAAAITASTGATGTRVGDKVYIYPDSDAYELTEISLSSYSSGATITQEYRDKLALKLFVSLMKTTGYELQEIDEYTPNEVESWSIDITEDGYYEIFCAAVPYHRTGGTYTLGQIVYYPSTETYYKVAVASTTQLPTHADWSEATEKEDFEDAGNLTQDSDDELMIGWLNLSLADANMLFIDKGPGPCKEKETYETLRDFIEGAVYAAGKDDFTKAQKIVERAYLIANDLECSC